MQMDGIFSKEALCIQGLWKQMSMKCLPYLDMDIPGFYLYMSQHLKSTHGSLAKLSVQGQAPIFPMP